MTNRRSFLKTLATTAAAATGPLSEAGDASTTRLIGSQLYGWGQYYQREGKPLNIEDVLSALRDAGYDYAENSTSPDQIAQAAPQFAAQLRAKGLKPFSMYTGGRFHDDKAAGAIEKLAAAAKAYRQAGFKILVCNPDPIGRAKTDAELQTQAENLKTLGAALTAAGIRLALHHHTPEMANDAKEFHSNFQKTDPHDVGFCYDVHWVFRGGLQPPEVLRQYGSRVITWHLRQSRGGIWWEDLDTGDIDYAAINRYAKENNLPRGYTVELALENGTKITHTAVENHRRSLEFIRQQMA